VLAIVVQIGECNKLRAYLCVELVVIFLPPVHHNLFISNIHFHFECHYFVYGSVPHKVVLLPVDSYTYV